MTAQTVAGTESSFDVRWAHWKETGAAQDRALDRHAAVTAVLALCALGAWLAIAVYLA